MRQRFFRKKPDIDPELVMKVDTELDSIKGEFTKQDEKIDKGKKSKRANE